MENASKALIIAGAILLSILIIGLGMTIFNQARSAMDGANLNSEKVKAYNNEFLIYEGDNKSGSEARQLCNAIIAHNNAAQDYTEFITVQTSDATAVTTSGADESSTAATFNSAIITIRKGIKSGLTYDISLGYDANTGYVIAVGITQHGTK